MEINELVSKCHAIALKSGWWNPGKSPLEVHMLIVSEIGEATEEVRNKNLDFYYKGADEKPEGESVELADAVIRIADYFGHMGWDLERVLKAKMDYNETRPHRHGDKRY